jgi:hypothetical protein
LTDSLFELPRVQRHRVRPCLVVPIFMYISMPNGSASVESVQMGQCFMNVDGEMDGDTG